MHTSNPLPLSLTILPRVRAKRDCPLQIQGPATSTDSSKTSSAASEFLKRIADSIAALKAGRTSYLTICLSINCSASLRIRR